MSFSSSSTLTRQTGCNLELPAGAGVDERTQGPGLFWKLARLRAENERLTRERTRGVSLKVSEKGGVSVYGLGRFPVTLYKEQWTRLLDVADDIRAFIKENEGKLKAKGE